MRLGAAGAGMQRDNGVAPVVGTAKQLGQLGLRHFLGDRRDFDSGFTERLFAFFVFGDIEKKPRLFKIGLMSFPIGENRL